VAVVVPTVLLFLGSLLAHELGTPSLRNATACRSVDHALDARWRRAARWSYAVGRRRVRIEPAGPAVSYLLAGVFFALSGVGNVLGAPAIIGQAFEWLGFVNILLGTFNLIPAAPLDGGRILAARSGEATGDRTRAEVVATRVGQVFGGSARRGGCGRAVRRRALRVVWTAIMGLFVYRTATLELAHARSKASSATGPSAT